MKLQVDQVTGDNLSATVALARQLQEAAPDEWGEVNEVVDWREGLIRIPKSGVILLTGPFDSLMEARDAWRRLKPRHR